MLRKTLIWDMILREREIKDVNIKRGKKKQNKIISGEKLRKLHLNIQKS